MKTAKELKKFQAGMKRKPTKHEKALAEILGSTGFLFKQQMILGFYILDFVIPDKMLAIEVDGSSHKGQKDYDIMRDDFIRKCGFSILHITNEEISDTGRQWDYVSMFHKFPDYTESTFRSALGKANALKSTVVGSVHR